MKRLLYILFLSVVSFSSCIDDIAEGNGYNQLRGSIHVDMEVKGLTSTSALRATIPAEEGEDKISSLYLLFFEPDTIQNGRFIDYVKMDGITGMSVDIDLSETRLTADAPYNILAVANIFDNYYISDNNSTVTLDSWLSGWIGKNQREVLMGAIALVEKATNDEKSITSDRLLMSASISKPENNNKINLLLTRNVARLDVHNAQKENYDLVSASIWNAYPTTPIWDGVLTNYSKEATRLRQFYGVDNAANSTGIEGEDQAGETLGDIVGSLYVFPNQVTKPEQNDKVTTCLIVGLKNRSDGTTSYYRANIFNSEDSLQMLVRNNVYRLTIIGVSNPGYDTQEEAYNGRGNGLIYQVNLWNMDDNGLIVQDENSILSLPTKTIKIGRDQGEYDYSVFVNSKLPDAAPLSILSQMYEPEDNGIVTSIDGNIIHVKVSELALDQTERRGIVILSYAGLQTAVNIIQSGDAETYLNVTLPDGGIPTYPAIANISSGLITVEASGPWSAQVYMDGFSFAEGKRVNKISSTNGAYINDNKFRIYTNTTNPEDGLRHGFVVVTLDSDPENYSSVVRVAQKPAGIIRISPDQRIVNFNIDGSLFVPLLPTDTNVNTFKILPNLVVTEDGLSEYVPEWTAEIIQNGMYDDRDMFEIVTLHHDPDIPQNNILTVNAVGTNYTGHLATATVRVSLTGEPSTFIDITLNQRSFEWDAPDDQNVSGKGGATPELKIDIPAEVTGLHYTVAIESFEPMSIYGDGKDQQFAFLVDGDDTNETPYISLQPNDVSVGFKVGFPSMPLELIENNIAPKVMIAVTLVETGETKRFTVSQEVMEKRPVRILDVGDYSWGNFTNLSENDDWTATWAGPYQEDLQEALTDASNFGPSGTVKTNGVLRASHANNNAQWNNVWPKVQSETTFINYTRPQTVSDAASDILQWIEDFDGLTIINTEDATAGAEDAYELIYGPLGVQSDGDMDNQQFFINQDEPDNPIINYLCDGPFGKVDRNAIFANDGTNGWFTTASIEGLGNGAIPILKATGTASPVLGEDITILAIDPSRGIVFKADSEVFSYRSNYTCGTDWPITNPDKDTFMKNFLAFCVNTAQYGSLFTNQFWDTPYDVKTLPQPQP